MGVLDAIIQNVPRQESQPDITVDAVTNDAYYVPQDKVQQFQQFQEEPPLTGALPENAYYPSANQPIAVGGYSGSQIGSTTLFAPGGGLVPLGMMDARQRAIQDAALKKQAQANAFLDYLHKQKPESKLTNINQSLYDDYITHVHSAYDSALKRTGGDAAAAVNMLKRDPEFWSKTQSYFSLAKEGTYIADRIAKVEDERAKGRVMAPSMVQTINELRTLSDPQHPNFSRLKEVLAKERTDSEFNSTAGDILKNMVASKTGKTYDLSNPEQVKIFNRDLEELTPEQKEAGLRDLYTIYGENNPIYSKDYIKKNWDAMAGFKKLNESQSISQKREDNSFTLELPDPNKEGDDVNVMVMASKNPITGEQGAPRQSSATAYDQVTLTTPVKVQIPISENSFNPATGDKIKQTGNVTATIGSIANLPVIDAGPNNKLSKFYQGLQGVIVDKDNIEKSKQYGVVKYKPMVNVQYEIKDSSGNTQKISEWRPLETVENALRGKGNKNDKALAEIKSRAQQRSGGTSSIGDVKGKKYVGLSPDGTPIFK